jgi:hypothetical protein
VVSEVGVIHTFIFSMVQLNSGRPERERERERESQIHRTRGASLLASYQLATDSIINLTETNNRDNKSDL